MEDLSSSTSFRVVIMIVGPAPGCSVSRGDNIWRSCVVRVLIYVLQNKKKKTVPTPCSLHDGSANYGLVLDPFWADFPHISRCWQTPDWFTHPHLFFSSNHNRSFFPLSPNRCLSACCNATSLRSPSTVPHIFMLPQQSPQGATEVQLEGSIAATLFWNHTPIPSLTILQSYLCIPILQYPHTLHLQVTQLSANDICCFWHQSLQSKAAQQQWEGKTDIVVKWWPSFLHFRWSASTLKFPILHIKKKSIYKEHQQP